MNPSKLPGLGNTKNFKFNLNDAFAKSGPTKTSLAVGDRVDRLNNYWMPALLFFFIGFIKAMGNPVECLEAHKVSNRLKPHEWEYALDYCSGKNHYTTVSGEHRQQLAYYNWVQMFLLLQMLADFMIGQVWKYVCHNKGPDFRALVELGKLSQKELTDQKVQVCVDKAIRDLVKYFFDRNKPDGNRFAHLTAMTLSKLYMCYKLANLINCVCQFLLLNTFLNQQFWPGLWGVQVLQALYNGEKWQDSPLFARMALCDVNIHLLGDTAHHTIQCHLRINTYNEKIFFAIWVALAVLTAITFLNWLGLFISLCPPINYKARARRFLRHRHIREVVFSPKKDNEELLEKFASDVLSHDGFLILSSIRMNFNPELAHFICYRLFILRLREKHPAEYRKLVPATMEDKKTEKDEKGREEDEQSKTTITVNDDDW